MTLISPRKVLVGLVGAGLLTAGGIAAPSVASGTASAPQVVASSQSAGWTAFAWGRNTWGQLGLGTTGASEPNAVGVLPGANSSGQWWSLGTGGRFSCGIAPDASLYCWGSGSGGALGGGSTADDSLPAPVALGQSSGQWTFVDGGWNFNCGLGISGDAYCWGAGSDGQLGNGGTSDDSVPLAVLRGDKPAGAPWSQLSVGYGNVCALAASLAYCWGSNAAGELGVGTRTDVSVPTAVLPGANASGQWTSISAGSLNSCGVSPAGAAYCWGGNSSGQLGNGTVGTTDDSTPVLVDFPGLWTKVEAGEGFSCGISTQAELYCWGANNFGQLGNGTSGTTDDSLPIKVPTLSGVTDVALGQEFACATTTDRIYCWGNNDYGQVGNGNIGGIVTSPFNVVSGSFFGVPQELSVGNYHATVLMGVPIPDPPAPIPADPASPPRLVQAMPGDQSASVSWSIPESAGSFPITHYQVVSSPGGRTCLTSLLTCEVGGLSNGTGYTFTVKALTGAGWSAASLPSNVITPVATPKRTITITGSRDGKRIEVKGTTTGFGLGGTLRPWLRFPGQSEFTEGSATILVSTDGTFEWSRRTGKRVSVYVATPDESVRSNRVTIPV